VVGRWTGDFGCKKKGIPTLPGMPVRFLTSHMLVCCKPVATRPAAFLVSSVVLPASFSALASGSVADAEAAAPASQLQVEAFAAAEAAGWVVPRADDSVVVPRAAPGDSAAALPVDDSAVVPRAAPGDSAAALPVDDSAVVPPEAPDDSAVALRADDSAVVLPEAPDGLAVVLPEDDSAERAAESAVPGGQHWARWQDGRWSASPLCREAPA
jgi:hypothetical protein